MVKLIKGQDNVIPVRVTSLMDYSGYSAALEINGTTKKIENIKSKNVSITFTSDEIDEYGNNILGYLTIFDGSGKLHMKMLIQFKVVDTAGDALGFQKISVVIVSSFNYNWSGGGGGRDVVRKSDFADIEQAKASINSCQKTVNAILDAVSES